MLEEICSDFILRIKNLEYDILDFRSINIQKIINVSKKISLQYNNIVIVGMGASSLNIRSLLSTESCCNVIYLDTIDEKEVIDKLFSINLADSIFFALSRSGNTIETYLITKHLLYNLGVDIKKFYLIVPFNDNFLFNLGKKLDINLIEHDFLSSGRFGVISSATFIPLMASGIDVISLIQAAQLRLDLFLENPDSVYSYSKFLLDQYFLKRDTIVLFNYSYKLKGFCNWYKQILAESLGKNSFGITPLISRGTFDQHTMLQLYLEGPDNKCYNVITSDEKSADRGIDIFSKKIYIDRTVQFLKMSNRPLVVSKIQEKPTEVISKMVEYMLSTILIAKYYKLNPFDQPQVDNYKNKI